MKGKKIIETVKKATKYLGVSPADLTLEIIRLQKANDRVGLLNLYRAYKDFELRNAPRIDESIGRVNRNLDFICRVADAFSQIDYMDAALVITVGQPTPKIGAVRQFYRDVIEYHPQEPQFN